MRGGRGGGGGEWEYSWPYLTRTQNKVLPLGAEGEATPRKRSEHPDQRRLQRMIRMRKPLNVSRQNYARGIYRERPQPIWCGQSTEALRKNRVLLFRSSVSPNEEKERRL